MHQIKNNPQFTKDLDRIKSTQLLKKTCDIRHGLFADTYSEIC